MPIKLVATATTYEGSKNNFKSFFYGQSSTNPANFVKIDLVDVEITGLTEITIYKKNHISKTQALLACALRRVGGLKSWFKFRSTSP